MNLYVHVPFCRGKCAYCAFYSEPRFDGDLWKCYLAELERRFAAFPGKEEPVTTLYIGGGTPTLPPVDGLRSFFRLFRDSFSLAPDAEISIECNPETITPEKAELLAGFANRVSMGAQSFSPVLLEAIGRTSKDPEKIRSAFRMLRSAGIGNIGLDLMYALPGEDMTLLKQNLDSALELEPTHLSAYSLKPRLRNGRLFPSRAMISPRRCGNSSVPIRRRFCRVMKFPITRKGTMNAVTTRRSGTGNGISDSGRRPVPSTESAGGRSQLP